jgi:hypothetical protein
MDQGYLTDPAMRQNIWYGKFTHFPWSEGDSETGLEVFRVNTLMIQW